MKIRTGFISNSSSSSFVTVYLPDNFDYDVQMEWCLETKDKWKKEQIVKINYNDFKKFKKNKIYREAADWEKYYGMKYFLYSFIIDSGNLDSEEGNSEITLTDSVYGKAVKKDLEEKCRINNEKYELQAERRRRKRYLQQDRREKMKEKMRHIDPYGEEEWIEDEENDPTQWNESMKIKKFREYEN